jgi:hypothetical protein
VYCVPCNNCGVVTRSAESKDEHEKVCEKIGILGIKRTSIKKMKEEVRLSKVNLLCINCGINSKTIKMAERHIMGW